MTDIDTALDAVECLRGREREVEELPGGLTNVNLKVTTRRTPPSSYASPSRAASCSPSTGEAEHLNSVAAAEAGVGAPVARVRRGPGSAGRRLHRGPAPSPTTTCATAATSPGSPRRAGSSTRDLGSSTTSTCSSVQRTLPRHRARARVPAPDRYDEFEDKVEQIRRAFAVQADATGAVQQRPPRRQLHRRRHEAVADRLRVLRQQRGLLRARQPLERGQPDRSSSSRS